MKIEETYEFWTNYILNHPERAISSLEGNDSLFYAPYLDTYAVLDETFSLIFFAQDPDKMNKWHRLDGPGAINSFHQPEYDHQYWLNNQYMTKEQYYKHPIVIEHRVKTIMVEVLDSSD